MKKITAVVATLLIAHSAYAEPEVAMIEVEMTPMAQEKPLTAGKADTRFDSYALEGFGCCGLQQAAAPEVSRPSGLASAARAQRVERAAQITAPHVQLLKHRAK